jgi:hypothetical protein
MQVCVNGVFTGVREVVALIGLVPPHQGLCGGGEGGAPSDKPTRQNGPSFVKSDMIASLAERSLESIHERSVESQ